LWDLPIGCLTKHRAVELSARGRIREPFLADSVEKVRVSTRPNFLALWVRFSNADAGASSSPSDSTERVLNRSTAVCSISRRCRSYFGRLSTILHLELFQQNRSSTSFSALRLISAVTPISTEIATGQSVEMGQKRQKCIAAKMTSIRSPHRRSRARRREL
jgi:hypothetical protein